MSFPFLRRIHGAWLFFIALCATTLIYWPGMHGSWLFDDYPNIVDNKGVQPANGAFSSLVGAALSSPSSELKRPLASLSFAANYLATGLDPFWMKLTNLIIHLLNGWLVFVLVRSLLKTPGLPTSNSPERASRLAALIAACWLILPINLTGVLYVVQRMESMANLFVLAGLIGYVSGRQAMLRAETPNRALPSFLLCLASLALPTALGLLAKETSVMLPLFALLVEWALFRFTLPSTYTTLAMRPSPVALHETNHMPPAIDWRIVGMFVALLVLPAMIGLAWRLPTLLSPEAWATRDFTLTTRLLSEARIVSSYIVWTLLPTPSALSFYHDNVVVSDGLISPPSTLFCILWLIALITAAIWVRQRHPLAALGIALFLGAQILTATILPLELIYEHRNYFASLGLLLVVIPPLADSTYTRSNASWLARVRHLFLCGLMAWWAILTVSTAYAWGNPLRLAEELAARAPDSPRAQYELGRTYILYSHYDPESPFTRMAYAPLERAAALPGSSILPQQALIFMNARMGLPLNEAWWDSMVAKLKARRPGVQDESSLAALTQCARDRACPLPHQSMVEAFNAAMSHPSPSARLLATYADYAWSSLQDRPLGLSLIQRAVKTSPAEPAYRVTEVRMLLAAGRSEEAAEALAQLSRMNLGGQLDPVLRELRTLLGNQ